MDNRVVWTPDADIGIMLQHARVYGLRVSVMPAAFGGKWFWGTFGCMGSNKPKNSEAAAKRAAVALAKEIHDAFSSVGEKFENLIDAVDAAIDGDDRRSA